MYTNTKWLGVTGDTSLNAKRHIEKSFNEQIKKVAHLLMYEEICYLLESGKAVVMLYKGIVVPFLIYTVSLSSRTERDLTKTTIQGIRNSFAQRE